MNRSILIILCDFLLVTLVAFSNFEGEKAEQPAARVPVDAKTASGNQDLVGTLKLVLEDEQQTRQKLTANLQSTEQALAQREQKMKQFQADLRKTEEQARRLEQERAALAQQASAAQASLKEVQGKLSAASTENLLSKEKLAVLQADLSRREQDTQVLEQKLAETEKAAQSAQAEKQQLSAQLQVSETEKRLTREQVTELRGTVGMERQEKAKLQEHAIALATNVLEHALPLNGPTETSRMFNALRRNVRQLEALVTKVKDENTNLETEVGVKLERRQLDLWSLVEGLVHDVHPIAGTSSTELINEVPEDLTIFADASLLRRVFQNLIANAIRYTTHGTVLIGAKKADSEGAVACWVSDNGAGIPTDLIDKVFEKFEGDPTETGGGLGLAIVKTFVEAHGGTITVDSRAGSGTTFRFTLPAREA